MSYSSLWLFIRSSTSALGEGAESISRPLFACPLEQCCFKLFLEVSCMKRKPVLSFLTVVLTMGVVIAALVFGSHAIPAYAAGTDLQVNKVFAGPFPTNKQNEPSIAQNPTNLTNLIAGSNDEIGEP